MSASLFHGLRPQGLRRALLALSLCLGLGAGATGCFIVTDNGGGDPVPPSDTPELLSLDTGAMLEVTPGQGAGLFVEYAGEGRWDVYTSCDTDLGGRSCDFDVILSTEPGASIIGPALHDAEPVDVLELHPDGSIRVTTGTAGKLDGVTFTTDPGATIRVDMLLDGEAQPSYVNWVSGGQHQQGADTNPVDFSPTLP